MLRGGCQQRWQQNHQDLPRHLASPPRQRSRPLGCAPHATDVWGNSPLRLALETSYYPTLPYACVRRPPSIQYSLATGSCIQYNVYELHRRQELRPMQPPTQDNLVFPGCTFCASSGVPCASSSPYEQCGRYIRGLCRPEEERARAGGMATCMDDEPAGPLP